MKARENWTAEKLFEGRPEAFKLYKEIGKIIESQGPVTIEASKTQVSFGLRRKFAWLWLPQMWIKKRPEESIVLAFALPYKIDHPKIEEAVEPRPSRWTHHVLINKASDIDQNVIDWLQKARTMTK